MDVATLGIAVDSSGVAKGAADLDKLTNAAKKAETAATGVSSATENVSTAAAKVSTGANSAATALNTQSVAATKAARAMDAHNAAMNKTAIAAKAGSGNVANLAAQFQDIGVSLAGGMSPLSIALQQGTQLSAVLGPMGAGAAVRSLGAAFLSVISPVSLLTIGIVAAAGYVYQYFTAVKDGGASAEETLAKQEGLIKRVADRWGEAYPAIKAYNDGIQRTKERSDLLAATEIVKLDKLQNVGALIDQIRIETTDFVFMLQSSGEDTGVISDYQRALEGAIEKLKLGEDASGELSTAMGILQGSIENTANPAIGSMIEMLGQLITASQKTAAAVASVVNSAAAVQTQLQNTIQASSFTDNTGKTRYPGEFTPNTPGTPTTRPLVELEGFPKISGAGAEKQSAYASATRSMQEQTAALEAQNAVQAQLNPLVNDYGYAMTKAKAAADLLAAAERDKKTITPALTADINAQADALANATVAQAKLAEAMKNTKEQMEFAKSSATGFLSTFRQGVISGEGAIKSLGNATLGVLDKIASKLEETFVNSLFDSGGLLGSLFGSAFKPTTTLGGFIGASGAPALSGAISSGGGLMRPAGLKMRPNTMVSGGASANGNITIHLVNDGLNIYQDVSDVAAAEARKMGVAVEKSTRAYTKGQMHNDINAHLKNPRRKG